MLLNTHLLIKILESSLPPGICMVMRNKFFQMNERIYTINQIIILLCTLYTLKLFSEIWRHFLISEFMISYSLLFLSVLYFDFLISIFSIAKTNELDLI
jgi:hypothetical protein